ncbi:MAG: hypothetical protein Tsb0021_02710 [Chlamydiales bacterium]
MRLLWINRYASFRGGCEYYIHQTAQLLSERGVYSTLLCIEEDTPDPDYCAPFDHIVHNICSIENAYDAVFIHHGSKEIVQEFINGKSPVIYFFHDLEPFCLRGSKMVPWTNEPCKTHCSRKCYPLGFYLKRSPNALGFEINTFSKLSRFHSVVKNCDAFIVASDYMFLQLEEFGYDKDKVEKIPLYALCPKQQEECLQEDDLILFVGSLIKGKGVDTLLESLYLSRKPFRCAIAGDGNLRESLLSKVKELGISQRVVFLGKISHENLYQWYSRAMCVVLPARAPESFGISGIEAMAHKKPVIATNLGGVTEWLKDGVNGIVVPPNDVLRLTGAIETLLNHPDYARELGLQGNVIYQENFTPNQHVNHLMKCLKRLIEKERCEV